jgi:hypothetical protein
MYSRQACVEGVDRHAAPYSLVVTLIADPRALAENYGDVLESARTSVRLCDLNHIPHASVGIEWGCNS